jgi:hypothetical protein
MGRNLLQVSGDLSTKIQQKLSVIQDTLQELKNENMLLDFSVDSTQQLKIFKCKIIWAEKGNRNAESEFMISFSRDRDYSPQNGLTPISFVNGVESVAKQLKESVVFFKKEFHRGHDIETTFVELISREGLGFISESPGISMSLEYIRHGSAHEDQQKKHDVVCTIKVKLKKQDELQIFFYPGIQLKSSKELQRFHRDNYPAVPSFAILPDYTEGEILVKFKELIRQITLAKLHKISKELSQIGEVSYLKLHC